MGIITDRTWANSILIEWEPLEGQTFNLEFSGYTVGHYATGNPELGWCLYSRGAGGCWNQRTKQIKAPVPGLQPERIDGQWWWVDPPLPEARYLGSTRNGEQFKVKDDRKAEPITDDTVKRNVGEDERVSFTAAPIRYFQVTDHEKEGQLFQIEFREDLFELKVQNEQGKPVVLTLTERELRESKHPVDAVRDFMIEAGVPAHMIDEDTVEDARRECDAPQDGERSSASQRHSQAVAYSAAGDRRVANDPPPAGQKFLPGTRVRIADDLGPTMRHFPSGRMATVHHTYAHAFGGDDIKSYCLDVDGFGRTSWYDEDQLTAIEGIDNYHTAPRGGPINSQQASSERPERLPITQTQIDDAGPASTFVEDRLAESIDPGGESK